MRKFWELPDELWPLTVATNLIGAQILTKALVPGMLALGHGRIINVTTSLGTMYLSGRGAYGPSKAAAEANSAIKAQDLENTGVTVNVVIPGGPTDTRMINSSIPLAREDLLRPEVMNAVTLWLGSDASAASHGRRFIAARWDESLPIATWLEQAGAPIAWPQLGSQFIAPKNHQTRV
jgi:NAD(P)-dependent dehydrogenase (short-subunit alcohol dehydrogenase family)